LWPARRPSQPQFGRQSRVARQAEDVVYAVGLAPRHQFLAAEAAVGAQQDPRPWPAAADLADNAGHFLHRSGGAIDVRAAQRRRQQVPTAEDVQRQIAIAIVIAMEEPAFLLPVQGIIGGIEIKRDLCRGLGVGIEEQVDEQPLDGTCIGGNAGIAGGLVAAEFQPVQCAFASQRRAVAACGCQFVRKRRQHRVMAELVVVVEVLITQRNADNPLHHQRLHRMLDIGRIAAVLETDRQAMGQAQHPIRRSQQQRTGVTGDGATVKRRNNRASFSRCKRKQVRVTLCRHRGLLCVDVKPLLQKNFRSLRAPMHLTLVRDVG
jgi:hypothetical protein